jgi:hypothetical protein
MSDFPVMEYQDPEAPVGETALGLLQAVYRDKRVPLPTRMRAATIAVAYETPKLCATAIMRDENAFAGALERAIQRSAAGKVVLELAANPAEGGQREERG